MTLLGLIKFRNPFNIAPVIIQCFMLLSASLIILGLVYVIILVIAIGIHHYLYDREAKRVPSYVKNSIQFDSDSETDIRRSKNYLRRGSGEIYTDDESNDDDDDKGPETKNKKIRSHATMSQAARRAANLDKFLNYDSDMKKIQASAIAKTS